VDTLASWALDAAIALITFPLTVAILGHGRRPTAHAALVEVILAAFVSCAPLIVRRRWPLQVLAFILLVALAIPGPAVFSPPALVALYTVASRRPRREAAIGAAATVVVFVLHRPLWGYSEPLFGVIAELALVALAVALGLYQSTRLAYNDELHERAVRLERERELVAERAINEERLRIARELHDVVAHNVSLMVVQAQALGATAGRDPASTAAGARVIADLGRGAMDEMHRTLEILRPDGSERQRAPQPALSDLDELVEQARAAGVDAALSIEGTPRTLARGVELSAYRIVQESLTNVIRHAAGSRASIVLRYSPDRLEVEVTDDAPPGLAPDAGRGGHGLLGMRERVALFGGTLEAGPRACGGYRVHAVLPDKGEGGR
jgi:signal transduction histidine kinase